MFKEAITSEPLEEHLQGGYRPPFGNRLQVNAAFCGRPTVRYYGA
jgi:hypothetical protein